MVMCTNTFQLWYCFLFLGPFTRPHPAIWRMVFGENEFTLQHPQTQIITSRSPLPLVNLKSNSDLFVMFGVSFPFSSGQGWVFSTSCFLSSSSSSTGAKWRILCTGWIPTCAMPEGRRTSWYCHFVLSSLIAPPLQLYWNLFCLFASLFACYRINLLRFLIHDRCVDIFVFVWKIPL